MPHSIATLTIPSAGPAPDVTTGSIFWIGHATVLICYAGFTILTDPTLMHLHEQVPLGYGLHTTRLKNPGGEIQQLPPLDLVVLSHFHGDHFDQVAEQELAKTLPIVTTLEAAHALEQRAIPIHSNDYDIFTSPLAHFQQEVQAAGLEARVHYLRHGDTYTCTVASTRAEPPGR